MCQCPLLCTGVRANIHLRGQTEFCPNGKHKLFSCDPPGRKNNNEVLQCLFFDGRRVVPDERLLCYPARKCISGRWILVPFGDTPSQTNVLCFARINVVSARILGGQLPTLTPRLVRLCICTFTVTSVEEDIITAHI